MLRISYRKLSVIVMLLLAGIGAGGIYLATQFETSPGVGYLSGPKFYPQALCGGMIILALIEVVRSLRKPDKVIEIPNFKNYLIVLGITVAWVLMWQFVMNFYFASGICIFVMLVLLNPIPFSPKKILSSVVTDVIIVVIFYLLFTVAFGMNL